MIGKRSSGSRFRLTRLAPTPSGYLHLGNIFSFSITARLAELTGAETLLRIDDLDRVRVRPEYLQDVFESLSFLGIPWQRGPRDVADFENSFSQASREPLYQKQLEALAAAGLVYACNCTRAQLEAHGEAGYPGHCRNKGLPLDAADSCWRFRTDPDQLIEMITLDRGAVRTTLPATMRDFVVRKKDGHAAYQLASLCDDTHFGTDLIVRGADLWDSTLAQLTLAGVLGHSSFSATRFYHHQLFYEQGGKLSKTTGAASIHFMRSNGSTPAGIFQRIAQMAGMHAKDWRELGDGVLDKLDL